MTTPLQDPKYRKENPFALKFTDEPEQTYSPDNPFHTPVGPPDPGPLAEPPARIAIVDRPPPVTDEAFRELLSELQPSVPRPEPPPTPPTLEEIAGPVTSPMARDATAVQLREKPHPEIGGTPESGGLKRFAKAVGPAFRERVLMDQRPVETVRRKQERLEQRVEAGNIVVDPEDFEVDLATQLGDMLGGLADPTILVPFIGGAKAAMTVITAAAKKGIPLAKRFLQLATANETAPIAQRALSSAVRAFGTAGTGAAAAETVQKVGREGELPTPGEAAAAFVGGTLTIPPIAAGVGALGGMLARLRFSQSRALLAPRDVVEVADAARASSRQARGGRLAPEEEIGYARRILGLGEDATDTEISAAFRQRAAQFHPEGSSPDEELFKVFSEATSVLRREARPRAAAEAEAPPTARAPKPTEAAEPPARAPEATVPTTETSPDNPFKPGVRQRVADFIDPERADRLERAEGERRSAEREAETDELTGLGNKRAFQRARETAEQDPDLELVILDINNLKAANDLVGHDFGDERITQAAAAIQRAQAEAGVPERAFRVGGDEFVAVVPQGTGADIEARAAELYGETPVEDFQVSLSGSAGPTFAEADAKLQEAKLARKGDASYRPSPPQGVEQPTADATTEDFVTEAVVTVDGREFGGPTHAQAIAAAIDAGALDPKRLEVRNPEGIDSDLFRTNTGELIDRFTASERFGGKASAESLEEVGLLRETPPRGERPTAEPAEPTEATTPEPAETAPVTEEPKQPRVFDSLEDVPEGVETKRLAGGRRQEIISESAPSIEEPKPEAPKATPEEVEPMAYWREHLFRARQYAIDLGINEEIGAKGGWTNLDQIVDAIDRHLAGEAAPGGLTPPAGYHPRNIPGLTTEQHAPFLERAQVDELVAKGLKDIPENVKVTLDDKQGRQLERILDPQKYPGVSGRTKGEVSQWSIPWVSEAGESGFVDIQVTGHGAGSTVTWTHKTGWPDGIRKPWVLLSEPEQQAIHDELEAGTVAPTEPAPQISAEEGPDATIPTAPRGQPPAEPAGDVQRAEEEGAAPSPPEHRPATGDRTPRAPAKGSREEPAVQSGGVEEQPGGVGGVARPERGGDRAAGESAGTGRGDAGSDAERLRGLNYRVDDPSTLKAERSPNQKATDNISAVRLLKEIEARGTPATRAEQEILAKYTGWGFAPQMFEPYRNTPFKKLAKELQELLTTEEYEAARHSTPNAHYTSPEVVMAIWEALRQLGFTGGRVLEPGMGAGYFLSLAPKDLAGATKFTGVELDNLTGRMAKVLFPAADVRVQGFETFQVPDGFYDATIGNVPFGDYKLHDPKYNKHKFSIHDYFFAKALDKVRPGGVLAFITSRYTMDRQSSSVRKYLAERADLVGAIRLPNTAFQKVANTKVTTDLIILRKRHPGEPVGGAVWTGLRSVDGIEINEYFADLPEMMLGTMELTGTQYAGQEPTLAPREGDLSTQLAEAIDRLPSGLLDKPVAIPTDIKSPETILAPDTVKEGAFVVEGGKLTRRLRGEMVPAQTADGKVLVGKTASRVKELVGIRDAARAVLTAQLQDASDADIRKTQRELQKLYDRFVKKFGPINKRSGVRRINLEGFREDPDAPLVAALENVNEDKGTFTKASIFTERVIQPPKPIESVDKPEDALVAVLNERGRVDLARMSELSGLSEDHLIEALEGQIFEDPDTAKWESTALYLSGNVRAKLVTARGAALADERFQKNVEALEGVQPEDLPPSQIEASLGAPWIPPNDIAQFIADLINDGNTGRDVRVFHTPALAEWRVDVQSYIASRPRSSKEWGTDRAPLPKLVDDALNLRETKVYDRSADGTSTLNAKETVAAQAKLQEIKERFQKWLWEDPARGKRLHREYNDNFNNQVPFRSDGSHMTFPGMAQIVNGKPFQFRPHQPNAIWRALQTGNTLLAHVVGAGKTAVMVSTGMEAKRIGLAHKPLYVVPNHMLEQFTREFLQFYPAARVLMATKEDLAKDRRQAFMAKVATNDWDGVVMTHSSFGKIPMSPAFEEQFLREQLESLREALIEANDAQLAAGGRAARSITKRIEKSMARLEVRLKELEAREAKDDLLSFEELGTDMIFVDEAHLFKNLYAPTKMQRVQMGDAKRAMDLYMKTKYIDSLTPGRGLVFATGTPISNTITEMFTMMRYLMPRGLKERGMEHLDAWAAGFGDVVTQMELRPEGGFRMHSRFARFRNVPELAQMFRSVADVQTADMLKLPRPTIRGGQAEVVSAEQSEALANYQRVLVARAEAIRGRLVEPEVDNMLKLTGDGRRAALDMRLVDPNAEDLPTSKVNIAVDRIHGIWEETASSRLTQMVFIDLSTPKPKKAAAPKQPKGMQIWTHKGYVNVPTAKPVTFEGFEEFQFVVHKGIERKGWSVTELSSGNRVAEGATMAEASETAEERLQTFGLEKTKEAVQRGVTERAKKDTGPPAELPPEVESDFSVYGDMKEKLIGRGIPAKEIAFIHDAKTDLAKERLFESVRQGSVRILLGSTEKLGMGTNVQDRLIAMHHLDAPWRPSDIEQRDGRILRQGNMNDQVEIIRYVTEGSFDGYIWQLLEVKARFIDQVMRAEAGVRSVEDVDQRALTFAEIKAIATGSPLVMEKAQVDADVQRLSSLERSHVDRQFRTRQDLVVIPERRHALETQVAHSEADAEKLLDRSGKNFSITLKGQTYTDRKTAGDALLKLVLGVVKNPTVDSGARSPGCHSSEARVSGTCTCIWRVRVNTERRLATAPPPSARCKPSSIFRSVSSILARAQRRRLKNSTDANAT